MKKFIHKNFEGLTYIGLIFVAGGTVCFVTLSIGGDDSSDYFISHRVMWQVIFAVVAIVALSFVIFAFRVNKVFTDKVDAQLTAERLEQLEITNQLWLFVRHSRRVYLKAYTETDEDDVAVRATILISEATEGIYRHSDNIGSIEVYFDPYCDEPWRLVCKMATGPDLDWDRDRDGILEFRFRESVSGIMRIIHGEIAHRLLPGLSESQHSSEPELIT